MIKVMKYFFWFGGFAVVIVGVIAACGVNALAQGSRKDDIVFNAQGRPMAGAGVRVCTSAATGQPCSPLALIYSDPGLTQALANPISTDGLGNYTFYAAPGRYEIEISGPSITTKQLPNVILPNDPSTPTFTTVTTTSGISAFSLSLSGNLTVNGSAAVTGSLTVGGAPVPSTAADNQWTAPQRFKGPDPWRDITAYMPAGGCDQSAFTGKSHHRNDHFRDERAGDHFRQQFQKRLRHFHRRRRTAVHAFHSRAGHGAESECHRHGGIDHRALQGCGHRCEFRNVGGQRGHRDHYRAVHAHAFELRWRVLAGSGERGRVSRLQRCRRKLRAAGIFVRLFRFQRGRRVRNHRQGSGDEYLDRVQWVLADYAARIGHESGVDHHDRFGGWDNESTF